MSTTGTSRAAASRARFSAVNVFPDPASTDTTASVRNRSDVDMNIRLVRSVRNASITSGPPLRGISASTGSPVTRVASSAGRSVLNRSLSTSTSVASSEKATSAPRNVSSPSRAGVGATGAPAARAGDTTSSRSRGRSRASVAARLQLGVADEQRRPQGRVRREVARRELALEVGELVGHAGDRLLARRLLAGPHRDHQRVGDRRRQLLGPPRRRPVALHDHEAVVGGVGLDLVARRRGAALQVAVGDRLEQDRPRRRQHRVRAGQAHGGVRAGVRLAGRHREDGLGPVLVGRGVAADVDDGGEQQGDGEDAPLPAPDDPQVLGHAHQGPDATGGASSGLRSSSSRWAVSG